jgi:holo-[acyl-carrier protein] synthase
MSIYGVGVDLCDIERVKKSLEKHSEAFANRILHPEEKKIFDGLKLKERFLAKRFAAKEAFSKALGTGIADGVTLPNIEVKNDTLGKPYLVLHGKTLTKLEQLNQAKVHLSISDEKHYAIAQVIIETDTGLS